MLTFFEKFKKVCIFVKHERAAAKRIRSHNMCLAIPSKITKIENNMATIDVEGIQREASLLLLEDARVGDYVIVHAGFAISKLDEAAARETLDLLREAIAAVEKRESNQN
jgi:hydrogenase expression/formation protein HypC